MKSQVIGELRVESTSQQPILPDGDDGAIGKTGQDFYT
jgi:hypothetical protein